MIRWREEKDCYRVEVSDKLQAGCLGAVGCLASVATLAMASKALAWRHDELGFWVLAAVFLVFGAYAVWGGVEYGRHVARVEIAVRGGRARWEGRYGDAVGGFVEVAAFQRVDAPFARMGVEARLRDGRLLRVFGPWGWMSAARVDKLVAQLNEYLAADEEPPR